MLLFKGSYEKDKKKTDFLQRQIRERSAIGKRVISVNREREREKSRVHIPKASIRCNVNTWIYIAMEEKTAKSFSASDNSR